MAIVGIDLGTTTSEVAVYSNGRPRVLQDLRGKEIIDSYFGIDNKTREPIVGERVRSLFVAQPDLCVEQVKRKMGQQDPIPVGDQLFRPEEVSAHLLRHLKNSAEEVLNESVDRAVITVPAKFTNAAREATQQAGEIAGFRVERIINEPTAAALAYGHQQDSDNDMVMVYDLGGGTFDVSIVEFVGSALDVRASDGDPRLGGKDFDKLLLGHVADRIEQQHGICVKENAGDYYRLLFACEEVKRELSFNPTSTLRIPFFGTRNGQPISIELDISRSTFERLIELMVEKTRSHIERALREAKLKKSEITRVLLVGGSTRIPYVRRLVEDVMGMKPELSIDPDRAVALGAAIQAAIIDGETEQIIMDVLPFSLGTAAATRFEGRIIPGIYSEILPTNWKYLKPRTEDYYSIYDNQEQINFRVYQKAYDSENDFAEVDGEANADAGYHLVGCRVLSVPPGPAGQLIRATYMVNQNGVLDVKIEIAGEVTDFQITIRMDEKAIRRAQQRLDTSWQKSRLYDKVRALLNVAERELEKDMPPEDEKKLRDLLDQMKTALVSDDEAAVKRLEDQVTDLLFDMS